MPVLRPTLTSRLEVCSAFAIRNRHWESIASQEHTRPGFKLECCFYYCPDPQPWYRHLHVSDLVAVNWKIKSSFGEVLVRAAGRKICFEQIVGRGSRNDDQFPTWKFPLCLRSHTVLAVTTISDTPTPASHRGKPSIIIAVLISPSCRPGTFHGTTARPRDRAQFSAPEAFFCAQRGKHGWCVQPSLGGADITSSESAGHESRLYGMTWHMLNMQILPSRSAIPRTVMPHTDRSASILWSLQHQGRRFPGRCPDTFEMLTARGR